MKRYILFFVIIGCLYFYPFHSFVSIAKEADSIAIWHQPFIKIYLEDSKYKDIVRLSFYQWLKNLDKKIDIIFINDIEDADIKIFMQNDNAYINKNGMGFLSGKTNVLKKDNKIYKSEMYIQTINPVTNKIYDNNELSAVIMHEAGHALGLRYHSQNIDDVMYKYTNIKKTNLSERDISSLKCIYSEKKCLYLKDNNKIRLKEAKKSVHLFPDKSIFLINLGNIYREKNQLNKALKCFNKALNIKDDKFYKAYYYIGIINAKQKNYQEAYNNFEKLLIYEPDNFVYIEAFSKIKEIIYDKEKSLITN